MDRVDRVPRVLGFPNPVNELAARSVAAGVLALAVTTGLLGLLAGPAWLWLTAPLAAGFLARALTGPRLSPLGRLATHVIAPRLGPPRPVPGPPKRFAQALGTVLSTAAVAFQAAGLSTAVLTVLGLITVAAALEAGLGFCVGCTIFAGLMRAGVIPEDTCAACADITLRRPRAA
jgi:hypothetical protein